QDSNLVQEYLLKAVSGEEDGNFNRFMVGDVKQSIYKFRLARPELFLEKYETYKTDEPEPGSHMLYSCAGEGYIPQGDNSMPSDEEKKAGQMSGADSRRLPSCLRIDLARNFRSRVQVVDTVNDVFGRMMSSEVGGIVYDSRAALYPGAVYPENDGCVSELILVDKPDKGDDLSAKQAEALAIAHKIKLLRESFLVTDRGSGEERPVKYGDMVILLRTNSGWDEEFKEVLEQEGIPVYITSKTGYFAAVEVQELLQVLRVLDNPCQDIPLFGVMKSIFGGFTEEEAARIRSHAKGCCLYEALKKFAEDYGDYEGGNQGIIPEPCISEAETKATMKGPEEDDIVIKGKEPEEREIPDGDMACLGEKAAAFLRMIASYRAYTVYLPIRELLTKLINDFGYLDYVTALPTGSKKRANVEMLLTRASDFEKTSYFGLFHFIRYMGQLEKYDVDYGGAEQLDENADVVRIMSIHKSKGLEFPVTFVAGMSKRFNMQDVNQSLILDMDLGLGTDYVDPDRRICNKTLRRTALSRKLREESLAEELRLLYVAMTRAREKLIMTGAVENARVKWERQLELGGGQLSYLDFVEAGSFLDFLLPVLPGTCVEVSVTEQEEMAAGALAEQLHLSGRREALALAGQQADSEAEKRLRECLNAVYPYAMLSDLYTKTTVSELKIAAMADRDEAAYHTFEEKEVQPYIPMFRREEEKVSGSVRGNAYHRVMELLDFEAVMKFAEEKGMEAGQGIFSTEDEKALASGVRAFLQKEAAEKRLTEEYFQAVNVRKIVHFLRTPLAARMYQAEKNGRLYREQPFVLGIDARRLKSDFPSTETVLIQGIIDVFFEEEDGLILLDYKTDSVASMKELWNRYETQLDYYQEAIQKIYGKPVKERILYSFHLEKY
ncbi:MAG TPA: helicase-exonuclease AddAB subunit AddA, partial [Lachnospiraceae bacterium]|nr:helicase-exonuclease AddAB subunit AddA [Lachnospiraceae bacterium]